MILTIVDLDTKSIPTGYNGVLVLRRSRCAQSISIPFGQNLSIIADEMEELYKIIPGNKVPPGLELEAMENQRIKADFI